jgi:hypothetical protein
LTAILAVFLPFKGGGGGAFLFPFKFGGGGGALVFAY